MATSLAETCISLFKTNFNILVCINWYPYYTYIDQRFVYTTFRVQCTGWRKKNACFSNNCNFVSFQYKKIMPTPKQPVINAVLITYINYSITENYIRKMASFLPYTRPEPLLKVLHHIY